ncbi:hypothetical protein, partial [Candidatus Pelagibacter communis]
MIEIRAGTGGLEASL